MKILIAEDDRVSRHLLKMMLIKWGHGVITCCNGLEAWQALQREDAPQLAIVDWMMPVMDGIEICREIRARASTPYTYIILLTAKSQKEDIVIGLDAGADDYIIKPFDKSELKVRLHAGERILDLQRELICTREALREQATHDSLTGLWNHVAIMDILGREVERAKREGKTVGVGVADLDHFKSVNDDYGHLTGDAVLQEVARRLTYSVRSYDSVGRYGGEEFLFVLPGCLESGLKSLAERLRAHICGEKITTSKGMLPISISMGVVLVDFSQTNNDINNIDILIQAADTLLYQAKNQGRNRVVLSSFAQRKPVL